MQCANRSSAQSEHAEVRPGPYIVIPALQVAQHRLQVIIDVVQLVFHIGNLGATKPVTWILKHARMCCAC